MTFYKYSVAEYEEGIGYTDLVTKLETIEDAIRYRENYIFTFDANPEDISIWADEYEDADCEYFIQSENIPIREVI